MEEKKILQPGRNCRQILPCSRVAFLVDGEAYYSAVAAAIERARHSVLILGWDIDSRIRLRRDDGPPLGKFLDDVVSRRRGLHMHVLDWDFAMLYALERESLPLFKFWWSTHRRLHFRLDSRHPVGASHHQKVVVVDDRVAFAGGLDLASCRWDTSEHAPGDPRRRDDGRPYSPFHDVQMMVDGETAAALGALARERWRRATGEVLDPPRRYAGDPWPPEIAPDLEGVEVALARTEPAFNGHSAVREVERLYLDSIAAARDSLYIEHQYLTSAVITDALCARLSRDDSPEVVLVLPRECSGWMEETTLGVLRARTLRQLRSADRFSRLRVYYPHNSELGSEFINVHSKVMIVDERLVRIGSSNLTNRSMGLDTECDLVIEADRPEVSRAIARFRARLLAEHLGTAPEALEEACRRHGSLVGAVESLQSDARTLLPLNGREENWLDQLVPEKKIVDPECPMEMEQFVEEIMAKDADLVEERRKRRRLTVLGGTLVAMLALAGAWRWTPMSEWIELSQLLSWGRAVRESAWAPLLVFSVYVLGGLVLVPVTLLILVTALTFTPVPAFTYALAGVVGSAAVSYGIGRVMGRDTVRRLAGSKLNRLSRQLAKRGLIAVVLVRFLPIAPFTVVNMVAGASHIRFWDFFFGTALGMAPGILAITAFERSIVRAVRNPEPENFILLGAVVLAIGGIAWGVKRWLGAKQRGEEGEGNA